MLYVAPRVHVRPQRGPCSSSSAPPASTRSPSTCANRVDVWLNAFKYAHTTGYQIVQARYSIAHGGFGGTGLGTASSHSPGSSDTLIPYLNTDSSSPRSRRSSGSSAPRGCLLVYMLFVARGFRIALLTDDGFSKLLAVGLTFAFALQAFIIVGGIVGLIR
jgi:cell division protein FtsW (lipid II flippase)